MTYAVIATGGKQYRVEPNQELMIEKLTTAVGQTVVFDQVYLVVADGKVSLGQPLVPGVQVTAQVVEHFRGPKIRVATYKAKSRHRRVLGHRQSLTRVKITSILETKQKGNRGSHQARRKNPSTPAKTR